MRALASPARRRVPGRLRAARPGAAASTLESAVERERQRVTLDLKAACGSLGTIGATAPFIGLFGTVVGIMNAFHRSRSTGQGGFTVVARGISEALITTAAGIAVAIEAVVIYNFFNQRELARDPARTE